MVTLLKKNDKTLINREVSWLQFNDRVLQEAIDKTNPLLERLKFLGIYSNNRDEFFRVRVATQKRLLKIEEKAGLPGTKYRDTLDAIQNIIEKQEKKFTDTYREIVKELAENNIYLIDETELTASQAEFVRQFFLEKVRPVIFPLMLNSLVSMPNIEDLSQFLAIHLRHTTDESLENFALIELPTKVVGRFVILPKEDDKYFIMLLEDVIRNSLADIFSVYGFDTFDAYTIKFTRDSELDLDNDISRSFIDRLAESIKQRQKGEPVRFVYDHEIPQHFLKKLTKKFGVTKNDTIRAGGRYHNFRDFMDFPKIGSPDLMYPPAPPLPHKDLANNVSFFRLLNQKDIMLHYPYQSFQYLVDFLREASIDPNVKSIKMTFYRAAKHSVILNALINAARNGKYVTVFMEIQARFDEEANIYWTQRLQEEGVRVIQTIPGYKVHAKLMLIRRREEDGTNHFYANISTGNFNESTARVYADSSLLTSNAQICEDIYNIFEMLESKFIFPEFKALKVAPFHMRDSFLGMLDAEIENAKQGKEAWAILKMNSMVDKKSARKLYEASQAGVKITLIPRAICIMQPGVEGLSENIEAFSIVDKFLEHARVYIFCNGGDNTYFIGSSDWMPRNFDHRVEVVTPIYDKAIQKELWDMMQIQIADNCKARLLGPENANTYRNQDAKEKHRAQFETYEYFRKQLDK